MSKKEAYQEKLESQLNEWSAKIDVLKAKAEKAGSESKVKYYETIEDLEAKKATAKEKLEELRKAGDDAWTDLKKGMESAWDDFESSVKAAVDRFK